MKAKIELSIPETLDLENADSDLIRSKIQDILNTADLPLQISSILEVSRTPKWQIWYEDNRSSSWVVFDTTSFGVPSDSVGKDEIFKSVLENITCFTPKDALTYFKNHRNETNVSPVVRNMIYRKYDPIVVEVYTPSFGLFPIDLSVFLLNEDGGKIESIASRGWEMHGGDIGTGIVAATKNHPLAEEAYEAISVIDKDEEFNAEIFSDLDEHNKFILETRGHKVAAFIDPKRLEAWLRKNRSELQYPENSSTPVRS